MHELSLCQAIVDTVSGRVAGRSVRDVIVRIGHLRQVVPSSLLFSWEILTDGTPLAGARLEIEHVPAVITCRACDDTSTLDLPLLVCEACGSDDVTLVSGEEFLIVAMNVSEEVV